MLQTCEQRPPKVILVIKVLFKLMVHNSYNLAPNMGTKTIATKHFVFYVKPTLTSTQHDEDIDIDNSSKYIQYGNYSLICHIRRPK